jgi:hypothetical protein
MDVLRHAGVLTASAFVSTSQVLLLVLEGLLSFTQSVVAYVWVRTLGAALRALYFYGPAVGSVGFWQGAADVDACAQMTGTNSNMWRTASGAATLDCIALREQRYTAFVVGFFALLVTIALVFVATELATCLRWQFVIKAALRDIQGVLVHRSASGALDVALTRDSQEHNASRRRGASSGTKRRFFEDRRDREDTPPFPHASSPQPSLASTASPRTRSSRELVALLASQSAALQASPLTDESGVLTRTMRRRGSTSAAAPARAAFPVLTPP